MSLLPLGVDSWILRLNDPVEKVIFFRLACAKGHIVATAPKTPFFGPLGQLFPGFPGISPDFSIDPLTHWVQCLTHWVQCLNPDPLGA